MSRPRQKRRVVRQLPALATMNLRMVLFTATLLTAPGAVAGQSTWCRYQARPLAGVIDQHAAELREEALADTLHGRHFSARQFPRRVNVVYSGQVRPVPTAHYEFLEHYFGAILGRSLPPGLFQREVLVSERDLEFWIPIQDQLVPQLESEAAPGDTVLLFVVWLGAFSTIDGELDWLFMINEFGAQRSLETWSKELAGCVG